MCYLLPQQFCWGTTGVVKAWLNIITGAVAVNRARESPHDPTTGCIRPARHSAEDMVGIPTVGIPAAFPMSVPMQSSNLGNFSVLLSSRYMCSFPYWKSES